MALSVSAAQSALLAGFAGAGFVLSGAHSKASWMPNAIAQGVVNELLASGKVTVPSRAGGTYPVSALSQSGMQAQIISALSGQGVVISNPFCESDKIATAVSKAVCAQVLSKLKVSIPTDGSGTFSLTGLVAGDLKAAINTELSGGIELSGVHAKGSLIGEGVAAALCSYLNSAAVVQGSFTSGGVYPIK
jgi:hypothetical protein